jgi:hypothetical protein
MGPAWGTRRHNGLHVRILCPRRRGGGLHSPIVVQPSPYRFEQQWGPARAPVAITVCLFASYVPRGRDVASETLGPGPIPRMAAWGHAAHNQHTGHSPALHSPIVDQPSPYGFDPQWGPIRLRSEPALSPSASLRVNSAEGAGPGHPARAVSLSPGGLNPRPRRHLAIWGPECSS